VGGRIGRTQGSAAGSPVDEGAGSTPGGHYDNDLQSSRVLDKPETARSSLGMRKQLLALKNSRKVRGLDKQ
jgi:hypothetical protein